MGQKTHPTGFRLSVRRNWLSRWYASRRDFPSLLEEDYRIRDMLMAKLKAAAVPRIFIERASSRVRVKIYTARPGVVIGKKGQEVEKIKEDLAKLTGKDVLLDIQEVKRPETDAQLIAENIALQLERRVAYRKAMKRAMQLAMTNGVDGIKVRMAGRLGGSEIARTELQHIGRVPLHTLRESIDFGFFEAHTVYGKIGVKVWVCKRDENS